VVADRMAVMNEGRIVQVGPPREVYERPASRFVAEFIGEANLFPDGPGFRLVRPERIALSTKAAKGARAGRVTEVAYFGDRVRYVVATGAGKSLRVSRPASGAPAFAVDDAVFVSWPVEAEVAVPG
jgi:ABC-type Fe3+/spermidine/putrescine transport system ATPase subunit